MNGAIRLVASSPIPPVAQRLLGELGEVSVGDLGDAAAVADADVLVIRSVRVDDGVLARAPRVRALARTGVGLDKVDVAAATRRGIPVIYAPDAGTEPVAEGAMALIFAACKRLRELREVVAENRWEDRYDYEGRDLAGATLGIVGLGRIGSAVARLGQGVGMRVIAHEPWLPADAVADPSIRLVALDELFRKADVITLHCSLTDETRGLVDRELLASVQPGTVLVNASRGGLVASEALLVEALDRGWLSAVGLDVFADEPPLPDNALVRDPRVICTPHTVGLTRAWNERVFGSLAADLRRLLAGERPLHVANPEVLEGART